MCEAEQWNLSKSYRAIKIYFHMQVNYNILPINSPKPWRVLIPSFQILSFFMPFAYYSF